jgi:anion-transporting  ArsA/GET3 family ATPase
MRPEATVDRMVRDQSIVICCGSGGVGKTTTAAAFALRAAQLGRRACVVTIDPARRLANSLGLDALTNRPTRIDGPWPGELHALMLDPKGTFDDLIQRYSDSTEQAEDIKVNRIYRNLTGTLSGTQEYMAMEKLFELVEEGGFDLVVVDTPPSRNALDFLDAPRRLTHFLENRLFQALMMPTRAGLKFMGVAAQALLRTISRVAGAEIVRDAVTFFQAFEGMEEGFRTRAARVRELLKEDTTFADDAQLASVRSQAGPASGTGLEQLIDNLAGYTAASDREEQAYADLVAKVAPAPVYRVPLLNTDVHDLDGLGAIADLLFTGPGPESPAPASAPPVGGPGGER